MKILYKAGTMGITELLPILNKLSRAEKLKVMQFLASEFDREEANLLKPSMTYPIWSPYDAFEAADTMLKALEAAKRNERAEC